MGPRRCVSRGAADELGEAGLRDARAHPRIDLLTSFLIRAEPDRNGPSIFEPGWKSGLVMADGIIGKPSFAAFKTL